jgi:hypothetical protein
MAIIEVPDILIRKDNEWKSLKNQEIYQDGWHTMKSGDGVYKDDNWYVLSSPYILTCGENGTVFKLAIKI